MLRLPDAANGWRLRVVPNLYPALTPEDGGVHELIIDSSLHAATFGELPQHAAEDLLSAARSRFRTLKTDEHIQYVHLFKNNGPGSGASMEHPHSQLLGLPHIPVQVQLELEGAERYFASHGSCIFCDLAVSANDSERIISENENAIIMAPHAPRFPFETWILPRKHLASFENADAQTIQAVGAALHTTLRGIETLLGRPPYNFLLHTTPFQHPATESYHWHIEILPRVAGIGGFEFGTGCYINTVSPEKAAAKLRVSLSR